MTKYLKASQVCVHGFDTHKRPLWYTYNEGLVFRGIQLIPAKEGELGKTWQAAVDPPVSGAHAVKAHERHQMHPAAWAARPIRGRAPVDTPEWIPGPERYFRQVVLSCMACGQEGYTQVKPEQYQAMLTGAVVVRITPCPRCGSRRYWEPFVLITAVPEKVIYATGGA